MGTNFMTHDNEANEEMLYFSLFLLNKVVNPNLVHYKWIHLFLGFDYCPAYNIDKQIEEWTSLPTNLQ